MRASMDLEHLGIIVALVLGGLAVASAVIVTWWKQ